jgi:hypothetical protein
LITNNDIDFETHQLSRKFRNTVNLTVRVSVFDNDILPFDITKFAQSLPKRFMGRGPRIGTEIADPRDLLRLLRFGWMHKYENDNSEYGDQEFFIHGFLLITVV